MTHHKSPGILGLFFACLYPSALPSAPTGNPHTTRVLTNNRNPHEGIVMNQTIRQKQAVLQVLHDRLSMPTAEMYQKIGREESVCALRFKVVPIGSNTFEVVERSTGASKGERFGHDNACQLAQQLENNADFFAAKRTAAKTFARALLRWTVGAALILTLFAYYGAGH